MTSPDLSLTSPDLARPHLDLARPRPASAPPFSPELPACNTQAVQECYVALSHGSLPLFRTLEFVGSCSFNCWMALASTLSVLVYEEAGMTAPFYLVAAFSGAWSLLVLAYFAARLRGRVRLSFAAAEEALLLELQRAPAPRARAAGHAGARQAATERLQMGPVPAQQACVTNSESAI